MTIGGTNHWVITHPPLRCSSIVYATAEPGIPTVVYEGRTELCPSGFFYGGRARVLWQPPLNWRSQPGTHPLHRIGLDDDLIEVITIDALKHAHLEPDPRGFDARQDHWT